MGLTAGSGLICALLMFLLSDVLSRRVLGEPMSAIAMKILAVNLIFASVLGLYRGFFQGMGTMVPTALSRFLEEVLCLIVMLVAAGKMGEYGSKVGALLQNPNYEQAFGAAGGILGLVIGSLVPFCFSWWYFSCSKAASVKKSERTWEKALKATTA